MSKPFTDSNPPTGTQPTASANVSIGNITYTDNAGKYKEEEPGLGIFTDYSIKHTYFDDTHRYMLGITSPGGFQGQSAAFVQLAAPTLLWLVDWTACRFNEKPKIPDPAISDPNWVYLGATPETVMITVGPDGVSPLYRISGMYLYGCKNPTPELFANVTFPRPPLLQDVFDRRVPSSALERGLIDPPGGGGGRNASTPGDIGLR